MAMFYAVAKGRKTGVFSTWYRFHIFYNNSITLIIILELEISYISDSGKSVKLMLMIFLGLCFKSLIAKKRLKHFSKMQRVKKFSMLLPEEISLVSIGNGRLPTFLYQFCVVYLRN